MSIERRIAWPLALLVVVGGCGDLDAPPPLDPPELLLTNQGTGDDRPLEQLKLHRVARDHVAAVNLLAEPLSPRQSVTLGDIEPGVYYLTVVRKQRSLPVSDRVALTTAEPIDLTGGRRQVWVFDESFRVFDAGVASAGLGQR